MWRLKRETLFLILIMLLAAVLRLSTLGHSAFRADTMDFFRYAKAGTDPISIIKNQPWENQIPLTEAYMLYFLKATKLPANPWTVRLPIALFGILAVYFVWKLASETFGKKTGLIAAFISAINPFAVSVSMEAYYYSGVICFAAFFLWASIRVLLNYTSIGISWKDWLLWLVAAVLMCSTHMTTWSIFGSVSFFIFIYFIF
ncbi:MAG: glycosyltransferase family 39 protein, partial [Lentisphaerae bacterium]|nr:glycosyltransferase family 39 protein [Lentisphaerota bacterium]